MQNIASLTKHVNELEMKPDALPAVNSRLQSRAAGAKAPEPDSEQSPLGGSRRCPYEASSAEMGALCTLLVSVET